MSFQFYGRNISPQQKIQSQFGSQTPVRNGNPQMLQSPSTYQIQHRPIINQSPYRQLSPQKFDGNFITYQPQDPFQFKQALNQKQQKIEDRIKNWEQRHSPQHARFQQQEDEPTQKKQAHQQKTQVNNQQIINQKLTEPSYDQQDTPLKELRKMPLFNDVVNQSKVQNDMLPIKDVVDYPKVQKEMKEKDQLIVQLKDLYEQKIHEQNQKINELLKIEKLWNLRQQSPLEQQITILVQELEKYEKQELDHILKVKESIKNEFKADLLQHQEVFKEYRKQVDILVKENEAYQQQIQEFQKKKKDDENDYLQIVEHKVESLVFAMKQQIIQKEKECDEKQKEISKLIKALNDSKIQVENLQIKLNSKQDMNQMDLNSQQYESQQVKQLQKELDELKIQYQMNQIEKEFNQKNIKQNDDLQLQSLLQDSELKVKMLIDEMERLNDHIEMQNQQIRELLQKSSHDADSLLSLKNEQLTEQIHQLQQNIYQKNEQIRALQSVQNKNSKNIDSSYKDYQIADLQQKLKDKIQELDHLNNKLKQMEQSNEQLMIKGFQMQNELAQNHFTNNKIQLE